MFWGALVPSVKSMLMREQAESEGSCIFGYFSAVMRLRRERGTVGCASSSYSESRCMLGEGGSV
jgi:hypothetical protein